MRNQWIKDRLSELKDRDGRKTQAGLAKAVGISPDKISKTIKGERQPQPEEMLPIAEYLEMPVELVLAKFSKQSPAPKPSVEESASALVALAESRLKFLLADDMRADLEADFRQFLANSGRSRTKA